MQNYDDGTPDKQYGHALVAGIDRHPRRVKRRMGKTKIKQRSKIKAFIKVYNYNHLMPTRYAGFSVQLKFISRTSKKLLHCHVKSYLEWK